jgi:hypothetical protein
MKKTASGDALDRALTDLYQADVPEDFKTSWRDAVKREELPAMKPVPHFTWLRRAALPMAAAVVLIAGTLVTGALNLKTTGAPLPAAYDEEADYGETYKLATYTADTSERSANVSYAPAPEADNTLAGSAATVTYDEAENAGGYADDTLTDERKIVRSVSLTLASADFEQNYDTILALAESAGGYASSVNQYELQADKRAASFTLQIPAENLDSFLVGLEAIGRITERYESADDLTTQYSDTELRLKTQQDKMTRLEELLLKAESVEDLLQIESEIANTQYQLDSLETALREIDRQVDYAAVSVYLEEQTPIDTAAAEDLTIGERIANGLKATLDWLGTFFENMLVFLTAAAPVLVPLILLYVVIRIIRKHRNSKPQSK